MESTDGSGYLMCYFTDPKGGDWLVSMPWRTIATTDQIDGFLQTYQIHTRRALAACAAFTFSLGYELWAFNGCANESERPHKSRQAAPPQNVFIAAKAAIEKETDLEVISHESNLQVRYTQEKITEDE